MYKRILLKLSGEALSGEDNFGINTKKICEVAQEIKEGYEKVKQIAIVVGGGNIWRGSKSSSKIFDRVNSDKMGMMATIMNSLALKEALTYYNIPCKVLSSIFIPDIASLFSKEKCIELLNKNVIIIFSGGTGNPYFSTDTAASLRAIEIDADIILSAKNNVDGVYKKDPILFKDAQKIDNLNYKQIIEENLSVIDMTAAALSNENNIDTFIFSMSKKGNITKAIKNQIDGSLIVSEKKK